MKKKLFSMMLVAALATSLLAGCGKNKKTEVDNTETQSVVESTQQTEADKVITVSSDMANITGNLGKGVALDCVAVSTDTEEYKAVEEYLKDTNSTFEMYDINLLDKSKNKVQPNGEVEVSVKLSDAMKNASGDAYVVFHNKGTEFTRISATEKDGYVTFKTTHFSIYTIVKYDSKDEATTEKINAVEEDMGTEEAGMAALKSNGVDKYVEALDKTMYATDNLVVRSGPNNQFTKLGTLSAGDMVTVTGQYEENGWYQIDYNGTKAYVSSLYVSEEEPKADNSENNNNNETVDEVKTEQPTASSGAGNSQTNNSSSNNSSSDEQNVASNTGNITQEPSQQPQQPEQTEPTQPSEPSQPEQPTDPDVIIIPDSDDICPYETLKWTYYQGHFGFFYNSKNPMRDVADMSTALYPQGGEPSYLYTPSYKDTGSLIFLYNDAMNENTVVMP